MSIQKKIYEDRVKNNLPERKMTPAEIKKRKKIGDKMPDETFKKKYSNPNPPAGSWSDVKWATATKAAMAGESVVREGKTEERELEIFIDNDQQLYRQQHLSIIKNLMTKRAQGKYDSKLAAKLYMYLVDNGAKKYVKEFGSKGDNWNKMFDKPTRMNVATALVKSFEAEAESGAYDNFIPKKYQKKEAYESDEKNFKPHMMYDPKTGKGYKADTYQDHLRMDKMGYTHEKPELDEAESVPLVRTGQGSFTKDTHPKRKDGKVERMYQAKDRAEYQKLQGAARSFESKRDRKSLTVTVVFDTDTERKAVEKKMGIKEGLYGSYKKESVDFIDTLKNIVEEKRLDEGYVVRYKPSGDPSGSATDNLVRGAGKKYLKKSEWVTKRQGNNIWKLTFKDEKAYKDFQRIWPGRYTTSESVEVDESNFDPKVNVFVFPSDREAKQFEKDIANAAVATGSRVGNKVEVEISALDRKTHKSVSVYMKKNKGKLQK